ncbi:MAG TPA: glycoside hydrolase family 2 TIM barrel-domain containing protein [Fimbriiglobus sp.]
MNSFAVAYVDGKKVGEIRFPAGEVDLTKVCRPGSTHVLSLLVYAMPLKGVLLSYSDTNSAREVKGAVERKGLCGDVFLAGEPTGARITGVKIDTSFRRGELSLETALDGLSPESVYALHGEIREGGNVVHAFTGKPFRYSDVTGGRIGRTEKWKPEKLWDLHTPQHQFNVQVTLLDPRDQVLDAFHPVRFGFREFWIDGRDFYLNGTRLHLSAVPLDNAQISARTATYEWTRETLQRLKSFGINFVYTHNYGCEPGLHVSFEELLRAADDEGVLVAFSQPHFGQYDWKAADADKTNGYARHAAFYVRVAQNHPAVVAYSMSHNATGYGEDMNPDMIDGIKDPRAGDNWSRNNAKLAVRAEAIVKGLDPGRIVYHHSSGNLGSMHTVNFYLNFVPIQEMSDWFEHWATVGVKPLFLCEYGVPFTWDWTMYRGWYKGVRSFGEAKVPWEFCLAEWNAQFLGDRAYHIGELEKRNLRWEAGQFKTGNLWHRWDYPASVGSSEFDDRNLVFARYLTDNWRAHRTWGLSANSPWEYEAFWKLRAGTDRRRKELKVDWDAIQKPGFSPDYVQPRNGWMSVDGERANWIATPAAEALIRNNRSLLAYIAGKPDRFTSKDHNYLPGESVAKQLVVLNNSRESVTGECDWALTVPGSKAGSQKITIRTGEQAKQPIHFDLPSTLAPGTYELTATVRFNTNETQRDSFPIHVLPRPAAIPATLKVALFDTKGHTAKQLGELGVKYQRVESTADFRGYDFLIVGREALSVDGPGPDIRRVQDGLKVVVFEQSARVLEGRLGFRVAEYGLREVFRRVTDHPLLAGLGAEHFRDWRGEATLLPSRLAYTMRPMHGPTVKWCGIDVSRPWRCGCRGNVSSVSVEKPARGDFLPILDAGYALQYSPLIEYHEGSGMVLFCQADLTGRSEPEPAADQLFRNILRYASAWKPTSQRKVLYAGERTGKRYFTSAGFAPADYTKDELDPKTVLIVGPGGGAALAADAAVVRAWIEGGGHVLAVGFEEADAGKFLPFAVTFRKGEHIAAFFDTPGMTSPLAGIGPADVHNRDPRVLPLIAGGGVEITGNGILAKAKSTNVVFCQLAPWQFDTMKSMNLERTFRRSAALVSRLAANMGAICSTPLLERIRKPAAATEHRWLDGYYLDTPEEWDDPYRFFRW